MAKSPAHPWIFRARFRRHAFGWKSQPAITRIKEAVSEIKKVARTDEVLAAEGAVLFLEKVSPARTSREQERPGHSWMRSPVPAMELVGADSRAAPRRGCARDS